MENLKDAFGKMCVLQFGVYLSTLYFWQLSCLLSSSPVQSMSPLRGAPKMRTDSHANSLKIVHYKSNDFFTIFYLTKEQEQCGFVND
jgi:hypothetical protein